ncbi:MAG TPA: IS110 family transposase [Mucilaginibacter sp.]|jgi:transposase|nr:IS110 family transposase [Mucilaginibacter sp.]
MRQKTSAATETGVKGRRMIDYAGKTIYVGVDIHKKDWQVGEFFDGLILGNHRIMGNGEELIAFLRKQYRGALVKCVYESGAWGFALQRQMSQQGIDCIVVHAGDVPGSDKERKNKTDKVDAIRLARHHAGGNLEAIHVPDEALQKERNLVRFRRKLQGDLTRIKNRLKSLLKFQGITIPERLDSSSWSKNFITWVQEQTINDKLLFDVVELMLEQTAALRQLLLKAERKIRALMNSDKYISQTKLLTAIPGIGPITCSLFLLEVGDVRRFRNFDALNNFVGFYPGSNSSGEKGIDTGISSRKHSQLRTMLVEAAWQAVRKDPAMLDAYQKLTKRMKGNEAIIRIARKLLRRMRGVLLSGQAYQKGVVA